MGATHLPVICALVRSVPARTRVCACVCGKGVGVVVFGREGERRGEERKNCLVVPDIAAGVQCEAGHDLVCAVPNPWFQLHFKRAHHKQGEQAQAVPWVTGRRQPILEDGTILTDHCLAGGSCRVVIAQLQARPIHLAEQMQSAVQLDRQRLLYVQEWQTVVNAGMPAPRPGSDPGPSPAERLPWRPAVLRLGLAAKPSVQTPTQTPVELGCELQVWLQLAGVGSGM